MADSTEMDVRRDTIQDVIDRLPEGQRQQLDLCTVMARSDLVPKELRTVSNLFVFGLTAQDLGLTLSQALRSIFVVNGRPSMGSDMMKALVLQSGKAEYIYCSHRGPDGVTVVTRRKGTPEDESATFGPEDAKRAKLSSAVWSGYPVPMMEHRAVAQLCRSVYPDVVLGMYTPEELEHEVTATVVPREVPTEDGALAEVDAIMEEMGA